MKNEELIAKAIEARKKAKSPTNYFVGAALLTKSGNVYTACNLGSDDGIFNICAERVAIVKMLSENPEPIEKIAVVGGKEDLVYTTPCGVCRQLIYSLGADIEIICAFNEENELKYETHSIKELLPNGFKY